MFFAPIIRLLQRLRSTRLALRSDTSGFTLIELLVSVSIIALVTGASLAQYNRFQGNVALSSLAYDIALSVRQAQTFGISVREFGSGSGSFDNGYGVHFDANTPQQYVLFADRDDNRQYDQGEGEEVEVFSIRGGSRIAAFCADGSAHCTDDGGVQTLDIVFERPDPDAYITTEGCSECADAQITVRSARGTERTITITNTGQVSVPPTGS